MYIIADIGGTNTRIAALRSLEKIDRIARMKTPRLFSSARDELTEVIDRLCGTGNPRAILLGVPGILDKGKTMLLAAPHLRDWERKNIASFFKKKYRCPVFLENDASLGALGEAVYGAGRRGNIVGYLAIGTGIGGARVVGKKIDVSSQGFEPGHQIVRPRGRKWPCGQRGCFDAHASGSAFLKEFGMPPEKIPFHPEAMKKYADLVGQGIVNTIVFWSPDTMVIGGGTANLGKTFLPLVRAYVRKNLKVFMPPAIVLGTLGDEAGLYGGQYLLKKKFIARSLRS